MKIIFTLLTLLLLVGVLSCKKNDPSPEPPNPQLETGTVTDIDGNIYKTVKIGTQWWMAENLKVTKYRNGNLIPNVTNMTQWDNLTTGAYCTYNHDATNVTNYGRLYNWYAANDSRNIAPAGWHVPSDVELTTLITNLGGEDFAGGKMKETGTSIGVVLTLVLTIAVGSLHYLAVF